VTRSRKVATLQENDAFPFSSVCSRFFESEKEKYEQEETVWAKLAADRCTGENDQK